MITINEATYQAMIDHMRRAAPAEGVGLLAGLAQGPCMRDTDGDGNCGMPACPDCGRIDLRRRILDHWVPLRNVSDFPRLRYEVDPGELVAAWETLEGIGRRPWIVCHSHTTTTAAPSQLDIRYATDPTLLHMIVSVHADAPAVGALWRIDDPQGVYAVERVGYRVVDLGFRSQGTTDLTRDVSSPTV